MSDKLIKADQGIAPASASSFAGSDIAEIDVEGVCVHCRRPRAERMSSQAIVRNYCWREADPTDAVAVKDCERYRALLFLAHDSPPAGEAACETPLLSQAQPTDVIARCRLRPGHDSPHAAYDVFGNQLTWTWENP